MTNIGNHSLDDIKLFMLCILSRETDREHVLNYLCALSDYSDISGENDFKKGGQYTSTTFFVEESMVMLDAEEYDRWLEYFKNKLLEIENYMLIHQLYL